MIIREAELEDAEAIAIVHVDSWRSTPSRHHSRRLFVEIVLLQTSNKLDSSAWRAIERPIICLCCRN